MNTRTFALNLTAEEVILLRKVLKAYHSQLLKDTWEDAAAQQKEMIDMSSVMFKVAKAYQQTTKPKKWGIR